MFVLDTSECVTETGFQMIREFTEQISMLLDIGIRRSLVGVILFNDYAIVHFPVTRHTTASTLLSALNPGLPYSGGGTNTQDALTLLRTAGQTGDALDLRSGYVPIAIVVTDGRSTVKVLHSLLPVHSMHLIFMIRFMLLVLVELILLNSIPLLVILHLYSLLVILIMQQLQHCNRILPNNCATSITLVS